MSILGGPLNRVSQNWGFCQDGGFARKAVKDNCKETIIIQPGQGEERAEADGG